IPKEGHVGFEIFDNTNMIGMTRFMEKVNYQRALQGELARSIQSLDEIVQAQVHLVIPEPSPFVEEEKPPSASIILRLRPGALLGKSQVRGIARLVSSSVEGLTTQHITIVDGRGNILFGGGENSSPTYLTTNQLELKRNVERYLTDKIHSLLTSILGPNEATAKVDVELNFNQIKRTEERYDPKSKAIKTEVRHEEIKKGTTTSIGGTPGVKTNLGQANLSTQGTPSEQRTEESNVQYLVNKTVENIIEQTGNIKKLSVAVAIDGTYIIKGGKREYIPRSSEEMQKFTSIIKQAIGYDESRGDSIVVTNVPFDTSYQEKEKVALEKLNRQEFLKYLIKYVIKYVLIGIGILVLFMILRPLVRELGLPILKKGPLPPKLEAERVKEKKETERIEELIPSSPQPEELIEKEISKLAENKPDQVAQIIKDWLTTNHGKHKNARK
ncbi:flagellar M-ring protein FliF, partial [Candidatus Aerophobetes bacterium]|nr:flagellar M-ring protein FliF [Candidatus Aerophobetes bacterium]